MEYKISIEASYTNNIHIEEKLFLLLLLLEFVSRYFHIK